MFLFHTDFSVITNNKLYTVLMYMATENVAICVLLVCTCASVWQLFLVHSQWTHVRLNLLTSFCVCPFAHWYDIKNHWMDFVFTSSGWHLPMLGETAQQWWTLWRSVRISVLILSITRHIFTIGQNVANKSCRGNWYILCQTHTHFFLNLMVSEELKIPWTCHYYCAICALQNLFWIS